MNIVGHHHISMYTKDAKRNKDFYTNVLGLRLVEKSVNQDNPSMYHLFYGDEVGTAGTILSFFEIPNAGHKQPGTETIYRFSLLVPIKRHFIILKNVLRIMVLSLNVCTILDKKVLSLKMKTT
ncbi:Lactoylglutathione lyase [Staphylococcus aureus]|nr:Lactoylglutathione lyase [Staphylococcus aureus]